MKSYTDLEQSKKLSKILPIESADMIWYGIYCGMDGQYHHLCDEYNKLGTIAINKEFCKALFKIGDEYVDWLPCWSLTALLSILPNYQLQTQDDGIGILCSYNGKFNIITANNSIDACYEMILKLYEQKLL